MYISPEKRTHTNGTKRPKSTELSRGEGAERGSEDRNKRAKRRQIKKILDKVAEPSLQTISWTIGWPESCAPLKSCDPRNKVDNIKKYKSDILKKTDQKIFTVILCDTEYWIKIQIDDHILSNIECYVWDIVQKNCCLNWDSLFGIKNVHGTSWITHPSCGTIYLHCVKISISFGQLQKNTILHIFMACRVKTDSIIGF